MPGACHLSSRQPNYDSKLQLIVSFGKLVKDSQSDDGAGELFQLFSFAVDRRFASRALRIRLPAHRSHLLCQLPQHTVYRIYFWGLGWPQFNERAWYCPRRIRQRFFK